MTEIESILISVTKRYKQKFKEIQDENQKLGRLQKKSDLIEGEFEKLLDELKDVSKVYLIENEVNDKILVELIIENQIVDFLEFAKKSNPLRVLYCS